MTAPRPAPTGPADWESANGRFLAAALTWLRLVLRAAVEPGPVVPDDPARRPTLRRLPRPADRSRPVPSAADPDAELVAAEAALTEASASVPAPALIRLAEQFGLSRFERDTLLLSAAPELDPSIAALCARAHGDDRMAYPSFGLALRALPEPAWDVLSPQRGLRYWHLVEVDRPAGRPLVSSPLRAEERVVNHLKGLNHLDGRLDPLVTPLGPAAGADLPPSQRSLVDETHRQWRRADPAVVQLGGADPAGKRLVAAAAAGDAGLTLCRLPAALLPTRPEELDGLARLWRREATLLPLALYLDDDADHDDPGASAAPVGRFLDRVTGPVFLATRDPRADLDRPSIVLDVAPPPVAERAAAWRDALGGGTDEDLVQRLASRFALDVPAIRQLAVVGGESPAELWQACRTRTRPRLDALAQRLDPKLDWADLVLPEEGRRTLHRLADQVANRGTVHETWGFADRISRGLGVNALFTGPSGTGKTSAAEVLARHLALDLYRIDLSGVVSKYIGETEKNLRRLFDAAEGGGVILFFDEADALFGRRSEVRDSHDRYANIEINYLLQRMESYQGLALLATNMRTGLDNAFLRRLRFVVEFTFPDHGQRREIWARAFPPRAPQAGLDPDRLARLQISGGTIRNIALNAAFLAAADGGPITMPLVLAAARAEFRKLTLPIRDRDFAWSEPAEEVR